MIIIRITIKEDPPGCCSVEVKGGDFEGSLATPMEVETADRIAFKINEAETEDPTARVTRPFTIIKRPTPPSE